MIEKLNYQENCPDLLVNPKAMHEESKNANIEVVFVISYLQAWLICVMLYILWKQEQTLMTRFGEFHRNWLFKSYGNLSIIKEMGKWIVNTLNGK